jgi:hypothetical protein
MGWGGGAHGCQALVNQKLTLQQEQRYFQNLKTFFFPNFNGSLTWTLCSFTAAGMISDPKSFAVVYLHFKSFSKISVLKT